MLFNQSIWHFHAPLACFFVFCFFFEGQMSSLGPWMSRIGSWIGWTPRNVNEIHKISELVVTCPGHAPETALEPMKPDVEKRVKEEIESKQNETNERLAGEGKDFRRYWRSIFPDYVTELVTIMCNYRQVDALDQRSHCQQILPGISKFPSCVTHITYRLPVW